MTAPLTDPTLRRVAALDPAHDPARDPARDAARDAADHPANAADARLTAAEAARADALLARLEATPRGTASSEHRRRRRLPGTIKTRLAAAGAAVLAVVGAMILVPSTASAEGVLLQAADAAALQPEATGEYWYVHWQITDYVEKALGTADFVPVTYQRENWTSREQVIMRDESAAALSAVQDGRASLDPAEVRTSGGGLDELGNPAALLWAGRFTWDELDALPTDTAALRSALLAATPDSGHGRDYDLYDTAYQLLMGSPAQPQVRRALWATLAGLDEASLLGARTDSLGREGTGVEVRFLDWYVITMVLDPTTGELLQWTSAHEDGSSPLTYTLVEQGPRDTAPTPEPPICGPGSVPLQSC